MIILLFFSLYSLLWIHTVSGFSACDEVDITFLIDAQSILSHHRSIVQFIQQIARHGSAEYTGYSVFVYGNLPNDIRNIELLTLQETQSMPTRTKSEMLIEYRLRAPFHTIKTGASPRRRRSVDVVTAFQAALRQRRPVHKGDRKKKLGYKPGDKSIGNHDGRHIYIVFDYNNRLLRDPRHGTMCALFNRLDRHRMYHRDQKIHFLLGSRYNPRDTRNIWCNRRRPRYIKYNSFHQFSAQLIYSPAMERIYDITCPAIIQSKTYDGYINVGNHVQYIDKDSVVTCNLYYWDHDHNVGTPDQLDTRKSFIKVKDFANDDNTWQLYDYLVADPKTFRHLKKMGCRNPVYKIIGFGHGVRPERRERDEVEAIEYRIMTLYVRLPTTPMEYISTANIKGNVPIRTHTNRNGRRGRRGRHGRHRRRGKHSRHRSMFHQRKQASREYRDFDDKGRKHPPPPPAAKVMHNNQMIAYEDEYEADKWPHVLGRKDKARVKKAVHHVVRKVEREIKDVATHTNEWKKLKRARRKRVKRAVINMVAKKKWTYVFTAKHHRNVGSPKPKGYKAIVEKHAGGALQIEYGFWYTLHVGVYFKFYWKILYNKIMIEYKIYGDWTINYHFKAKYVGEFALTLDNLLNDGSSKVFYIGSIPILIRAYTQIFAEIVTLPEQVHVGIRCQYKERVEVGYRYSNNGYQAPIKKRRLISKGCTKELGLLDKRQRFVVKCPTDEFRGFDLKFSVKIGGSFYLIMNSYLRMEFVIPFRVNYPEMNPVVCELPPKSDMCMMGPLKAAFTMSMSLNLYNGSWVDVRKIMHFVASARFMDRFSGQPMSLVQEQYFEGPIQIIRKRFMGCLELKGPLKHLNDILFPTCCPHVHGLYKGHMVPMKGQYVISANPMQTMLQTQGNTQSPFIPNPYYRPPPNVPAMPKNYGNEQRKALADVMNGQANTVVGMNKPGIKRQEINQPGLPGMNAQPMMNMRQGA